MGNIDKFKDFIKKYKKTRYISKDSSKKLKSIGLESFKNIESKIEKCLFFLNKKQDEETLKELLLIVLDEFTNLKYNNIYKGIKFTDEILGNKVVHIQNNDSIDVAEYITKEYIKEKRIKLDKMVNDRFWRYYNKRLVKSKLLENVDVKPILKIHLSEIVNQDYNITSMDYFKKRSDLKSLIINEEIIERYLSAIGFGDLKFKIEVKFITSELSDSDIVINLHFDI